jgi:hypothetical protein
MQQDQFVTTKQCLSLELGRRIAAKKTPRRN